MTSQPQTEHRHLEQLLRYCVQNSNKLPSHLDTDLALREYEALRDHSRKMMEQMTSKPGTYQSDDAHSEQSRVMARTESGKSDPGLPQTSSGEVTSAVPKHGSADSGVVRISKQSNETRRNKKEADEQKWRDMREMQETIKLQQIKISELTHRLSAFSSKQLSEGNPNIVDLSDSNRPTKLAERFSELYDNEWSDAFETIRAKHDEMATVDVLLNVVMMAYRFCTVMADHQLARLVGQLDTVLEKTEMREGSTIHICTVTFGDDAKKRHLPASLKFAKEYLRTFGSEISKTVQELFVAIELPKIFHPQQARDLPTSVLMYAKACSDIVWMMVIQDPAMLLVNAEPGQKLNRDVFNVYLKTGTVVKQPVWPAVLLHEGGPLISKGYARPE